MAANPKFRFIYVVWAFLEIILFGGLLFGWGSMVYVLKEDGVYSHLCDGANDITVTTISTTAVSGTENHSSARNVDVKTTFLDNQTEHRKLARNRSCSDRDKMLLLVFTIASMANCAGCAVMGQINFKLGTRLTRLCAIVVFLAGGLLTAFTTEDTSWIIFPGMSLLSVGGISLLMTNMQFSMLFTKGSSTVVGLLCGAFDGSSVVMLSLKLLYEEGVKLQWTMLFLTGLHVLSLINTFFFLPKRFISKSEDPGHVEAIELTEIDGSAKAAERQVKEGDAKLPSIKSCILSPLYLLHVTWFCILQMRFYYFISSLNTWLTANLTMEKVSYFTDVSTYTLMCGLITSPLAGVVYDFHKRLFRASRSQIRQDLMPAVIPLALTAVLAVVLSVLVLVAEEKLLYLTFIVVTVFRSFLYGVGTSFLGVMFPSEYFGILYGLMLILGGLFGLLQYGLFSWGDASGFTVVNYFLIGLSAVALIHPLYQWFVCWRAESEAS